MIHTLAQKLRTLRSDRSGAAMIEFAISLPILLLILAIVIEGSRISWTHQAAAAGVRDASRYIARLAPPDICVDATANIATLEANFKGEATDIVVERVGNPDEQILPGGVVVIDVSPAIQCMTVDYSADDIPVVEVRVRLEISFPFGGVFDIFGDPLEPLVTEIWDESRVYGV